MEALKVLDTVVFIDHFRGLAAATVYIQRPRSRGAPPPMSRCHRSKVAGHKRVSSGSEARERAHTLCLNASHGSGLGGLQRAESHEETRA